MTKKNVPRIGRILDLVGLLLFLAGAGVFVRAWVGFEGVRHYHRVPGGPLWAATRLANGFLRLQHLGGWLMAGGGAVFVAAWATARVVGRVPTPSVGVTSGEAPSVAPAGEGHDAPGAPEPRSP